MSPEAGLDRRAPRTTRELYAAIEAAGCYIDHSTAGHPRVLRPNGTAVMTMPLTSKHTRGVMNTWSRFKRLDRGSPR